jgi:hypothetical protein
MEPNVDRSSISGGVFAGMLLHVVQVPFLLCCGFLGIEAGFLAPLFIGVSQFAYVGPAVWLAGRKGQANAVRGLWIAAGITFLLNATCWGVGFALFSFTPRSF